jgi:hypothetical protein
MRRITLILLVFILAACGGDSGDKSNNQKNETPATGEPAPGTLSPVILALQQDYESLHESQQAIGKIWEDLAANQDVQCGSYPPPADLLRRAAIDIDHAIAVWKAECANPRRTPPPDVIDEGRLAARSAGDALRQAETLLADMP